MILAGDVGGTKTLLEVGTLTDGRWSPVYGARYAAADFAGIDGLVADFLLEWARRDGAAGDLKSACFGVAGPVAGNCVQMTNLPWRIDGTEIGIRFGIPRVRVINDFAAAAAGIELLPHADLILLQAGEPVAQAPRLVIGAGTGLGIAFLFWSGDRYHVVAGEGGHSGFAPATPEQLELCRQLQAQSGRVTCEDVVSGPGLVRIHEFVSRAAGRAPPSGDSTPAAIVATALEAGDPLSSHTLDLFLACYGEVAGNMALAVMARGGVYIAGGIAPRLVERLRAGGFVDAFNAKGRYSAEARKMPLSLVMDDRVGLLGCAVTATRADP